MLRFTKVAIQCKNRNYINPLFPSQLTCNTGNLIRSTTARWAYVCLNDINAEQDSFFLNSQCEPNNIHGSRCTHSMAIFILEISHQISVLMCYFWRLLGDEQIVQQFMSWRLKTTSNCSTLNWNKTPAQAFNRANDFCNVQGIFKRKSSIYGLI